MKEKTEPLRIYNFSHPLMATEMLSLLGDKYSDTLSFPWEFTQDYQRSDIVLWDGVLTIKNEESVSKVLEHVRSGKVLLLVGESMTLLKDHPMVKLADTSGLNVVEVPGWNILPEEILSAFESCHKKLNHV